MDLDSDRLHNTGSILIVDDDPIAIRALHQAVASLAQVRFATSGEQALKLVAQELPDVVLLDAEMPGMNGFYVLKRLQSDARTRNVPVIFVTSHSEETFEISCLQGGAADFITKPIRAEIVKARVRTQLLLQQALRELKMDARTDMLTRLLNRRGFDEAARRAVSQCSRAGHSVVLLMIDVDHFKRFNDHHGHLAGDRCLARLADAFRTASNRPSDVLARFGGEEFALLLPETDAAGGEWVAQRLLTAVQRADIPHEKSELGGRVTVSIGMAYQTFESVAQTVEALRGTAESALPGEHDAVHASIQQLIERADQALYQAKKAGRAQLIVAP